MSGQEERAFRRPFSSVPDIESYYPSVSAEGARVRLFRALDRGEGVAFLFGEAGLGTTLLSCFSQSPELDAPVITLSSARISSRRSFYLQLSSSSVMMPVSTKMNYVFVEYSVV